MIGRLAAQDQYALDELPDVGAPLVGSGGQFSAGSPAVNRVFDRLPGAVMGGLAQTVQTPGALMSKNPYPPGSEEAAFYDASKVSAASEWAPGMALDMMGGGVAGTGKGGGVAVGSGPVRKTYGGAADPTVTGWTFKDVAHPHKHMERGDWGAVTRATETGEGVANVELPIRSLNATQKAVNPDFASVKPRGDAADTPFVIKKNGQYFVQDGHHRLTAASESGKQTAEVRLVDLDGTRQTDFPLLDRDVTLGSGATDKKMGAILSATDNQPTGIKAYHSSPHDFDKFDLAKIGTGEGAQVYGHGLYFAESPAVSGQGGQYWQQFADRFSGGERDAATTLRSAGFDREKAAALIQRDIEQARQFLKEGFRSMPAGDVRVAKALAAKEQALQLLESGKPVGPRTYEVNIKADPAHMLDWDKPLSAQQHLIDPLREAGVSRSLLNEASGGDLYHKAAIDFHRPGLGHLDRALASEKFAEAGIPGIKYLDEGSRGQSSPYLVQKMLDEAKAGLAAAPKDKIDWHTRNVNLHERMLKDALRPSTSNYVIFDPGIIDIMKKYGIAGAAPAGLGALAAQDQYKQ
jgi:hypothetical protein